MRMLGRSISRNLAASSWIAERFVSDMIVMRLRASSFVCDRVAISGVGLLRNESALEHPASAKSAIEDRTAALRDRVFIGVS